MTAQLRSEPKEVPTQWARAGMHSSCQVGREGLTCIANWIGEAHHLEGMKQMGC